MESVVTPTISITNVFFGDNRTATPHRNKDDRRQKNENYSPLRSPLRRDEFVSGHHSRDQAHRSHQRRYRYKPQEFPPLPTTPDWTPPTQTDTSTMESPEKSTPDSQSNNVVKTDWSFQVQQYEFRARQEHKCLKKYCRKLEMNQKGKKDKKDSGEIETDPNTLMRRQKDIDYGKNTIGYDNFIKEIPRHKRKKSHPKTPNKYQKCSRRSWDGQTKNWRISLHQFDNISNCTRSDSIASDSSSEISSSIISEDAIEEDDEDLDFDINIDLALESPPLSPQKDKLASPLKDSLFISPSSPEKSVHRTVLMATDNIE